MANEVEFPETPTITPTEEQIQETQEAFAPSAEVTASLDQLAETAAQAEQRKTTAAETTAEAQRKLLEEQLAQTEQFGTERQKLLEERAVLSKEEQEAIATRSRERLEREQTRFEEEAAKKIAAQERANELGIVRQETALGLTGGFGSSGANANLESVRQEGQRIVADLESAKLRGTEEFSAQVSEIEENLGLAFRQIDQEFNTAFLDLEEQLFAQTSEITQNLLLTEDQKQQRIEAAISEYENTLNQLGQFKTQLFSDANNRALEAAYSTAQAQAGMEFEAGLERFRAGERGEERRIQEEQFATQLNLSKEQFDKEFGLREKELLFNQQKWVDEFGESQKQFAERYDLDEKQLAESTRQFDKTQKQNQEQFVEELKLEKGRYSIQRSTAVLEKQLSKLQIEEQKETAPLRKKELEIQIDLLNKQLQGAQKSVGTGEFPSYAEDAIVEQLQNGELYADDLKDLPLSSNQQKRILEKALVPTSSEQEKSGGLFSDVLQNLGSRYFPGLFQAPTQPSKTSLKYIRPKSFEQFLPTTFGSFRPE